MFDNTYSGTIYYHSLCSNINVIEMYKFLQSHILFTFSPETALYLIQCLSGKLTFYGRVLKSKLVHKAPNKIKIMNLLSNPSE
jgi:hypothetical protein